jgi:hypothetical protein
MSSLTEEELIERVKRLEKIVEDFTCAKCYKINSTVNCRDCQDKLCVSCDEHYYGGYSGTKSLIRCKKCYDHNLRSLQPMRY